MNYIVFDLEWNQSAEGKECSVEHMPFEIIEIGAVKLNSQMKQVSESIVWSSRKHIKKCILKYQK